MYDYLIVGSGLYGSTFALNFWHTTYKTSILQPLWPLFAEHVMYDDSILSVAPLMYGRTYVYYDVPVDLKECVQKTVKSYARFVFYNLAYLPYGQAKKNAADYYKYGYQDTPESRNKIARCYVALPFLFFYILVRIKYLMEASREQE